MLLANDFRHDTRVYKEAISLTEYGCDVFVVALQGEEASLDVARLADRAGWIAPAGGSGLRRAEIIRNRYGERASVPLRFDRVSGTLERVEATPPASEGETPPGSGAS